MIRVERHEEVRPGIWRYMVPGFGLEGRSRQPLPDADHLRIICDGAHPDRPAHDCSCFSRSEQRYSQNGFADEFAQNIARRRHDAPA